MSRPKLLDLLRAPAASRDCVPWLGWKNSDGYGYVAYQGRDQPAHRVAYMLTRGPILADHEIDHTCGQRDCVNPLHLEVVTHAENQRRLSLRQMSCRRAGHDWSDPRNVYVRPNGRRYCAECSRIAQRGVRRG